MKPPTACYYIQNKSYFIPPPADGFEDETEPLCTSCWCLQTHEAVGPDGAHVDAEDCAPGRDCYSPEVELSS